MSRTAPEAKDRKPTMDQSAPINLKVKGQDGHVVFFKIKRSTQLWKLLTAYCDRKQFEYKSMQFFYHGDRIVPKRTPDNLGMEDGDEIDAMAHQFGGGGSGGV